ncbi:MAG: transposase [Arsenophonus sp. NC-QC1-MAG3]
MYWFHWLKVCNRKLIVSCARGGVGSDSCDAANKCLDVFISKVIRITIPTVMKKLKKDREERLALYNFPSAHWTSIKVTNTIESAFVIVKL